MKMQPRAWTEYRKLVSYGRDDVGTWDFSAWKTAGTRDAWWVSVTVTARMTDALGEPRTLTLADEKQTCPGGTVADVRHLASLLVESLTERVRRVRGGA